MNAFLLEPLTLCTSLGRAVSPALLGPDISGTFLHQRSLSLTHTHTHSLLSCIMIPFLFSSIHPYTATMSWLSSMLLLDVAFDLPLLLSPLASSSHPFPFHTLALVS
ncbi:Protein priB [Fusarium oxysporum f. sp. albedinis]|nr:Protein priB [Fusarium oxysporum f. sp. albedinis]